MVASRGFVVTRVRTVFVVAALLTAAVGVSTVSNAGASPGYTITSSLPPDGTEAVAYSHTFTADTPGATWTSTGATLPTGLSLDSGTGELSGTPTVPGTYLGLAAMATWHDPFTAISAGSSHTCGLTTAGTAICWGDNTYGQTVDQVGTYTAIAAGESHSCALAPTGSAACWGNDGSGQATDQTGPYTAISAGNNHTCALTTVVGGADCWGDNYYGQATDQTGPYIAISAGNDHTCALLSNGAADCWGYNDYAQATDQTGPYTAISAGNNHTCALTSAGALDCWGDNTWGQATDKSGPYDAVSAGDNYTCALASVVSFVECWGYNADGQAASQGAQYSAVSAGANHSCAITVAGAADCWGLDDDGQAADQPIPIAKSDTQAFSMTIDPGVGGVSGKVTEDGSGDPLEGISVRLIDTSTYTPVAVDSTDASGDYSFSDIATGDYVVRFIDMDGNHSPEYHSDTPSHTTATTVSVTAGNTEKVDASLAPADIGIISGTVTEELSSYPLENISTRLLSTGGVLLATRLTKADGTYSFGIRTKGDYLMRFIDLDDSHFDEWHLNAATRPTATVINHDAWLTTVDAELMAD